MSAPSVLERCRMALAEIGRPVTYAFMGPAGPRLSHHLNEIERWILRCTVRPEQPLCLPCCLRAQDRMAGVGEVEQHVIMDAARAACGAWRPFQRESCGATQ